MLVSKVKIIIIIILKYNNNSKRNRIKFLNGKLIFLKPPSNLLHAQFCCTHITDLLCVLFCLDHNWGVHDAGKFEGIWMLPVLLFIQGIACFFNFFYLQTANGYPAYAFHPVVVVCLIDILQRKGKTGVSAPGGGFSRKAPTLQGDCLVESASLTSLCMCIMFLDNSRSMASGR